MVRLRTEDALCLSKWIVGVNQIISRLRWIWPPSLVGHTSRFTTLVSFSLMAVGCFIKLANWLFIADKECRR